MYARLWWKETRQFWPIWVIAGLAAPATQWLFRIFLSLDSRYWLLGVTMLAWAMLYALAAGAAAFAGEREAGTLSLLDALPVDRGVVWSAKVSFALVTTAALALALLVMAALSSDSWIRQGPLTAPGIICVAMLVPVALGWGLFWSSVLRNGLSAALVALACTAVCYATLIARYVDSRFPRAPSSFLSVVCTEGAVVLATLAGSDLIFTRGRRFRRVPFALRSPIVVMRNRPARAVPIEVPSSEATVRALVPAPVPSARTNADFRGRNNNQPV
jgi:hypothetical protein